MITPTLRLERRLLREHALVIACDEVGRGALAGPVTVGAAVLDASAARRRMPEGLRDSKLVPEARRPALSALSAGWVSASALGWAQAREIDEVGITRALGLAARRALEALAQAGVDVQGAMVLLDGNHDYITAVPGPALTVRPVIKADRDCASAAAASVIAKVARDDLMRGLHEQHQPYEWASNKGYASAAHRAALAEHGPSAHHRLSWSLTAAPALF